MYFTPRQANERFSKLELENAKYIKSLEAIKELQKEVNFWQDVLNSDKASEVNKIYAQNEVKELNSKIEALRVIIGE